MIIIFPDLPAVEVEGVEEAEKITLILRTVSLTALCPSCGTISSRIQSRYTRKLRDLPSVGRPLQLIMHVRRFFCNKSTCAQKIFVERLSDLCHPRAQRTKRLQEALRYLGLITGGQAGADLGSELGISGSRGTPYSRPRRQRARLLDPYHAYLLQRWKQGCHNVAQLEAELRAKGYKGSQRVLYRYLATLEPSAFALKRRAGSRKSQNASLIPSKSLRTMSVQQITWLFFRKPDELKEEELESLRVIRQASPSIETAYHLVELFLQMVRERTGEQLDGWLETVKASQFEAFESFVTGVQQDKDAVLAGLTLPWSNSPLERNVNRLKLIKRSMYGRAEVDLLKLRVLY